MPTCLFILARFTLRVDHVLFRTYDTRIYHSFASSPPLIVRERGGWEAPYERVQRVRYPSSFPFLLFSSDYILLLIMAYKIPLLLALAQHLPKRDDMTPLTDPTFIAKVLTEMPKHVSQKEGAKTGWRGLGSKTEIAILTPVEGSTSQV